jgi:hypothetical protein
MVLQCRWHFWRSQGVILTTEASILKPTDVIWNLSITMVQRKLQPITYGYWRSCNFRMEMEAVPFDRTAWHHTPKVISLLIMSCNRRRKIHLNSAWTPEHKQNTDLKTNVCSCSRPWSSSSTTTNVSFFFLKSSFPIFGLEQRNADVMSALNCKCYSYHLPYIAHPYFSSWQWLWTQYLPTASLDRSSSTCVDPFKWWTAATGYIHAVSSNTSSKCREFKDKEWRLLGCYAVWLL